MALGFRGGMADNPAGLTQWTEAARRLIEVELGRVWINPPSREPHIHVPPLSASERFSNMATRIGLLAMLVIPLVILFLMLHLAE